MNGTPPSTFRSRRTRVALAALAAALWTSPRGYSQVDAQASAKLLKPAEGLQAVLWASEPLVINPTTMDIDSRGRVWVTEGLNYRLHRNVARKMERLPDADKIKILEDTDDDGKADKVTVFADKIFPVPMGIAVEEKYDRNGKYVGCRVYVGNSPNLLVLEDTDGDDKADTRFPLLTGFGGIDSDHGVHGMTLGIDGKLYFTHGDGCCSVQPDGTDKVQNFDVTDKSGKKVSTDQLATTLRVNRDGTDFEILADRQRNNYETTQDSYGHLFTSDNDDDGRRGSRVIWVMDGGRYGYRTPGSPLHWGEDVPGNVPKLVGTGNGSPCGIFCYEGTLFGESKVGSLLEADAGTRQINWFPLTRQGAAFRTTYDVFLGSDDPWFRPVDVAAAPDGSVFVADWYDAGVGGHAFSDQTTGRIYRVTPKGVEVPTAKPQFKTVEGLIAALGSPAVATRDAARRAMIERKEETLEAITDLESEPGDSRLKARALWVWHAMAGDPIASFALVKQDDARIREQIVRILGRDVSRVGIVKWPEGQTPPAARAEKSLSALTKLADDPDTGVRRELILALRELPTAKVGDILKKLTAKWDGQDRWYLEALGLALQNRESDFVAGLFDGTLFGDFKLESTGSATGVALPPYFPTDRSEAFLATGTKNLPANALTKTLGLAWRLRRAEALDLLAKIRPALHTPELQQAWDDAVRQITDPKAASFLAKLAKESTDTNRTRQMLSLLAEKLDGDWRDARGSQDIKDLVAKSIGVPALAEAGVRLASRTGDPALIAAIDEMLTKNVAEPVKIAVLEGLVANKAPMAAARINAVLESAMAAKKSSELDETAVRLVPAIEGGESTTLQVMIGNPGFPLPMRRQAVRSLVTTVPGARAVIRMAVENKLPGDLKTEATTALYAHPNREIREASAKVLPPPQTAGGRPLPPIYELVRREGNAEKGATVFFRESANSCAGCHRVGGKGRWVGPDLSTIGVKYGREELLHSILNPSAAVGYNYRPYVLALKDGRVVTGLPLQESEGSIVLKTAEGKTLRVAKADIEENQVSPVSLMPEGLPQTMTDQELVDLLAYLTTLKRPSSIVGQFQTLGPLPSAADPENKPAIAPDANVRVNEPVKTADGMAVNWRRLTATVEGLVDMSGAEEGQSTYLWTVAVAPLDQKARLVLDSALPARVWVNGKEVPLTSSGDQTAHEAPVDLVKGANRVLVRVRGAKTDDASLGLTIVADAPIEFRDAAPTEVGQR
jgi:putative membrane-bound dehydrogenase-like protein